MTLGRSRRFGQALYTHQ